MNRPLAIVNARLITFAGEIPSGVILINEGVIVAAGPDHAVTLPVNALLLDAEKGQITRRSIDAPLPVTAIPADFPADLVCRSRFGDVVWAMKAGAIIAPPDISSLSKIESWTQRRYSVIKTLCAWLEKRQESVHCQRTDAIPGFQKRGIDILWRFQKKESVARSLSIHIVPALNNDSAGIFVLDHNSARKLPAASLGATVAHWWFYYHAPDNILYCLPTAALKRWLTAHAKEIPPTQIGRAGAPAQLSGRSIPIARLQRDIPKARIMRL